MPSLFWRSEVWTVEAVGHGLVRISDGSERKWWAPLRRRAQGELGREQLSERERQAMWERCRDDYCVINLLTRWCKVVPRVPFKPDRWLPPTSTGTLTILGYMSTGAGRDAGDLRVATYDVRGGGGGGGWDLVGRICVARVIGPDVALCAGQTYVYHYGRRLHVLAPGGADGRLVETAAALEEPSVAYRSY